MSTTYCELESKHNKNIETCWRGDLTGQSARRHPRRGRAGARNPLVFLTNQRLVVASWRSPPHALGQEGGAVREGEAALDATDADVRRGVSARPHRCVVGRLVEAGCRAGGRRIRLLSPPEYEPASAGRDEGILHRAIPNRVLRGEEHCRAEPALGVRDHIANPSGEFAIVRASPRRRVSRSRPPAARLPRGVLPR